jgi:hypothetical protein
MRKQTQSLRQRLLQEQSAQYLNESELPFTVPLSLPVVDSNSFVSRTGDFDVTTIPRKG